MLPEKQGLYSPDFEHDNCGAGFICSLEGKKTNDIIGKALDILVKLEHRGAVSADGKTSKPIIMQKYIPFILFLFGLSIHAQDTCFFHRAKIHITL